MTASLQTSDAKNDPEACSIPIRLPDLGANAVAVRVSVWFVQPGEPVHAGESVVAVSFPGIVVDLPAPAGGILRRHDRAPGAAVLPGDILGWIDSAPIPP